ncbi:hypothetical protein G6N82_11075 [Altererythrobacter sp. BO-6]|uniref:hypothetical protein n=1 Tax=Altererythrobacter sp. BO-6 TaxID=2604537 RepID=UPI0013E1B971|nr:hypothetical protein [Altererythrobacter sp. BO-6]QIG54625.1 hypothetical protein G6N82_11075 [Altererythrobacter sp. BO-6]
MFLERFCAKWDRLPARLARQDWLAVFVELVVVVAGILIALGFDQWAEERADRQRERQYLARLHDDLEIELSGVIAAEGWAAARLDAVEKLDSLIKTPERARNDPAMVPWAIETSTWRSFPAVSAFVYRELQDTGQMRLITSFELRRQLADHYGQIANDARVGEDRLAEERFDAGAAGLLSTQELLEFEELEGEVRELNVTPDRAEELARALAARPDAIREIPSVGQHHQFNLRVLGGMKARIGELQSLIESEQRRLGD